MIKKILYITVISFCSMFFMNMSVLAEEKCVDGFNSLTCQTYNGATWKKVDGENKCCFKYQCYKNSDGKYTWSNSYDFKGSGSVVSSFKNKSDCEAQNNEKPYVCKNNITKGVCDKNYPGKWNSEYECCEYDEQQLAPNGNSSGGNGGNKFNASIDTTLGTCVDYLGEAGSEATPAYYIDFVYNIVKVLVTVALVALSMMDLVKAIMNGGNELTNVYKKIVYRFLIVLVILLLPGVIESIGTLFGKSNILCGIG